MSVKNELNQGERSHSDVRYGLCRVVDDEQLCCAKAICELDAYELWIALGASWRIIYAAHKEAYRKKSLITLSDIVDAELLCRDK